MRAAATTRNIWKRRALWSDHRDAWQGVRQRDTVAGQPHEICQVLGATTDEHFAAGVPTVHSCRLTSTCT